MPHRRRRMKRKTKFVTKRGLPFQLMKYVETKYDVEAQNNLLLENPSVSANRSHLTNIRQGIGEVERIGNMVQITGVHVNIIFEAVNPNSMRFLRVVLYTPRSAVVDGDPVINMVDHPDTRDFIIWFDRTVSCPLPAAATPGGTMTVKKKFKPYMKTQYTGSLGSDISDKPLYLLLLPSANLAVEASYNVRTFFKDL